MDGKTEVTSSDLCLVIGEQQVQLRVLEAEKAQLTRRVAQLELQLKAQETNDTDAAAS